MNRSRAPGLVLFLFGMSELSVDLRQAAGARIHGWIERRARGPWRSLAVGCAASALLDSSSAVIILAIVLVNANSLPLRSAMGIVLAALRRTRGHLANILFHMGLLFFGL